MAIFLRGKSLRSLSTTEEEEAPPASLLTWTTVEIWLVFKGKRSAEPAHLVGEGSAGTIPDNMGYGRDMVIFYEVNLTAEPPHPVIEGSSSGTRGKVGYGRDLVIFQGVNQCKTNPSTTGEKNLPQASLVTWVTAETWLSFKGKTTERKPPHYGVAESPASISSNMGYSRRHGYFSRGETTLDITVTGEEEAPQVSPVTWITAETWLFFKGKTTP